MSRQKKAVGTSHGGGQDSLAASLLSTSNYSTNHTNVNTPPFSRAVSSLLDQATARYEAELEEARRHFQLAQQHLKIRTALERQFGIGGQA